MRGTISDRTLQGAAKKAITITNQTLVAEIISIDFIAETKTSLDKLIKDIRQNIEEEYFRHTYRHSLGE